MYKGEMDQRPLLENAWHTVGFKLSCDNNVFLLKSHIEYCYHTVKYVVEIQYS